MPTVSVIIPVYNAETTLKRAAESVLDQSKDADEIIVIDDGSTDHTALVSESFVDDRVQYLRFEENCGANTARNAGIHAADGDFISFLDADDVFRPRYLETVVDILSEAPPDVAGVGTSYRRVDLNGQWSINKTPTRQIDLSDLVNSNLIGSFSATTFRNEPLQVIGYLDEEMPASQDYDLYLRLAKAGYKFRGVSTVLVDKYSQPDGISTQIDRKQAAFDRLESKHGDVLTNKRRAVQSYMLGLIYARNGQINHARQMFWRAVCTDPTDPLKFYHLVASVAGETACRASISLKQRVNRIVLG